MRFWSVLFALTFYDASGCAIITAVITNLDRIFYPVYINLHFVCRLR